MTDDEFIASFENCSLANESFHHSDHVRMAFLYLCRYPALEALQRRRLLPAGYAPRCPEVDQDPAAAVVGERPGSPVR